MFRRCTLGLTSGALAVAPAAESATAAATTDFASHTAQIDEQILQFHSMSDADVAMQGVPAGYGCAHAGSIDIVGPTDVRAELTANNVDQAQAWQLSFGESEGVVVVAQLEDRLVSLHFLARTGAQQPVDPQQVIEAALAKAISGS